MKKKETSSLILELVRAVEGKSIFRERNSNFFLDIPAFRPLVRVGLRSKVVLRSKGYAWAPILGSLDNSRR